MRHGDKINNLGRTASHRRALLSNLTAQLIQYKRIQTTLAKAKALRVYAEPIINRAKVDSTHNRRHVFAHLQNKFMVTELFEVIGDKIAGRPGGYLRIIKMPRRQGDAADMALIELVDFNEIYGKDSNTEAKKTRRSRRAGGAAAKTAAPATDAPKADATEEAPATEAVETPEAPVISEDAPESQQEKASPEPTTETARTTETPPEHNLPQDPEPEQGNA